MAGDVNKSKVETVQFSIMICGSLPEVSRNILRFAWFYLYRGDMIRNNDKKEIKRSEIISLSSQVSAPGISVSILNSCIEIIVWVFETT